MLRYLNGKTLFVTLLATLLIGCAPSVKLRTEVQEQFVPLLYCPAPPHINRPVLPIFTITEETSDGDIAKKYKMSIALLQGYIQQLERTLKEYNKTNAAYEELRKRFKTEWKTDFNQAIEEIE